MWEAVKGQLCDAVMQRAGGKGEQLAPQPCPPLGEQRPHPVRNLAPGEAREPPAEWAAAASAAIALHLGDPERL